MDTERLDPLNDYLFCKILGESGDEEQLLSFLNAVLNLGEEARLEKIEILENKTLSADVIGKMTSLSFFLTEFAFANSRQHTTLASMPERTIFVVVSTIETTMIVCLTRTSAQKHSYKFCECKT